MRHAVAAIIVIALAGQGLAAKEPGPAPSVDVKTLPVNQWVLAADEPDGGCAAGGIYLPDQKGVLLFGKRKRRDWRGQTISKRYWVEIFKPEDMTWHEWVPEAGRLEAGLGRGATYTAWVVKNGYGMPAMPDYNRQYWEANQRCYMPGQKRALFFHGGVTFTYDPAARTFENKKIPFNEAPPDVMLGSMAWDPLNKEAILFGGGYIHAYKKGKKNYETPQGAWKPGDWDRRGTWAYDPRKNRWRKLKTASEDMYQAHARLRDLRKGEFRDVWGGCRGVAFEYDKKLFGKKPAERAAEVEKLAAALTAFAQDTGKKGTEGYEKARFTTAAGLINESIAPKLAEASEALKAEDGWKAFQAIEAARKPLIEAEETLAPAPRPRHYTRLVVDPKNEVMVLWGGDGEDRWFADTWILDLKTHRWERCRPKIHPPVVGYGLSAMDYDARNGVVVLTRQSGDTWVFDAVKREWTALTIPNKGFRGQLFMSLVYDPASDVHVLVNPSYQEFKTPPRKTYVLKLDLKSAAVAEVENKAPEEVWRPQYGSGVGGRFQDKFGMAWKHLPKTQAEYRARVEAQQAKLKALPPNKWTRLSAPYSGIGRAYGSFCYYWDREELHMWGGGHSAYMGNEWTQYDLDSNLWMESWNPEYAVHPFGSPDGPGWGPSFKYEIASCHGYHHFVYFGGIKKVVLWSKIYDPDRMRYAGSLKKTGPGNAGPKVEMNGHPGLMSLAPRYHAGGPFGVWSADPETLTLKMLPGSGTPFHGSDRNKWVFDTKRNRILCYGTQRQVKVNGKKKRYLNGLWAFSLADNKWTKIVPKVKPEGAEPPQMTRWNYCYSSKYDCLMLHNGHTWIYDCASNTFRKLDTPKWREKSEACGVVYSKKHDLFYAIPDDGYGRLRVYVFKYQPQ